MIKKQMEIWPKSLLNSIFGPSESIGIRLYSQSAKAQFAFKKNTIRKWNERSGAIKLLVKNNVSFKLKIKHVSNFLKTFRIQCPNFFNYLKFSSSDNLAMKLIKIITHCAKIAIFTTCLSLSSYGSPLILVGHPGILKSLDANQVRDVSDEGKQFFQEVHYFFIRDLFIQRLDGKVLRPRIPNRLSRILELVSLLPTQEKDQIQFGGGYGAFGLRHDSQELASSIIQAYSLESYSSHSVLEGGNVFLQEDRAIVGIHSVALTMLLHEEEPNDDEEKSIPSDHAFSIARNRELSKTLGKTIRELRLAFSKTLSDADKDKLKLKASLWQTRINRAKSAIAEDFGVELEKVTFLIQQNYHIDLDIIVSPNGAVFLNESNDIDIALLQQAELEENGWRVYRVKNNSEAINGIFVGQQFFTLNQPTLEFEKALIQENYSPVVIDGFSDLVKQFRGGLRCLTLQINWE